MTKDQEEILAVVERINDKLNEGYGDFGEGPLLVVVLADIFFAVSLSIPGEYDGDEIKLFKSSENDRIYFEDLDEYEPWEDMIQRKLDEYVDKVRAIKLT